MTTALATDWRASIEHCLRAGIPDMALRNCHAVGVDSIVLGIEVDDEGRKLSMTRVFVAHHDRHELDHLWREDGHYIIGVHNHRYPLTIDPVVGELINHEVTLGEPGAALLYEFKFQSGITDELDIVPTGNYGIADAYNRSLVPGDSHYMEATDLHTVVVPKVGVLSAWMVTEGPGVMESFMYSMIPDPVIDPTGMYLPLAKIEAERVLDRVMEEIA